MQEPQQQMQPQMQPQMQQMNPVAGGGGQGGETVVFEGGVACKGESIWSHLFCTSDFCKCTHYRITTRGVEIKKGRPLSKCGLPCLCTHVDHVEMWRIKDVSFRQSCTDSCCNTGTIVCDSNDPSFMQQRGSRGTFVIRGLNNSPEIYKNLRDAMISAPRVRMEGTGM